MTSFFSLSSIRSLKRPFISVKMLSFIFATLFASLCFGAKDGVDRQLTVQVTEARSLKEARSLGGDQAVLEEALRISKKLLGGEEYKKVETNLKSVLPSDIGRFAPSIKVLKAKAGSKGYLVTSRFKISEENLKTVLSKRGFLNSPLKTGIVFPFMVVTDHTLSESYNWWNPGVNPNMVLQQSLADFEKSFSRQFLSAGFQVLQPEKYKMEGLFPSLLKKKFLTKTEMSKIALLKNSQLYLDGKIDIMDLSLIHI